jgi:hypothetical protein
LLPPGRLGKFGKNGAKGFELSPPGVVVLGSEVLGLSLLGLFVDGVVVEGACVPDTVTEGDVVWRAAPTR